jgi:EF hand
MLANGPLLQPVTRSLQRRVLARVQRGKLTIDRIAGRIQLRQENTMKCRLTATVLIVGATLAGGSALASAGEGAARGERAQKMHERIKAADKDNDGRISGAEADASLPRIAKRFGDIDANKDGFLTRDELRAWHRARAEKHAKTK